MRRIVPSFFALAGTHACTLFEPLGPLLRSTTAQQELVMLDPRPGIDTCLASLPNPSPSVSKQMAVWAGLELGIAHLVEAQQARKLIVASCFGLEAVLHACATRNCADIEKVLKFQAVLVPTRLKTEGVVAPRYIVVTNDSPESLWEQEVVARYVREVPGQLEPLFVPLGPKDGMLTQIMAHLQSGQAQPMMAAG